jgi:hypothetical protein
MRTDGPTDMTKLIVAFRNFANAPNNQGKIFLFDRSLKYYKALVKILL